MAFVLAHKAEFLAALLGVSELLGVNPKIKANSIFQLVVGAIKKVLG